MTEYSSPDKKTLIYRYKDWEVLYPDIIFNEFFPLMPKELFEKLYQRPVLSKVTDTKFDIVGWKLQFVVPGFYQKCIHITSEGNKLKIIGDNIQNDTLHKDLVSCFHYIIETSGDLDLPKSFIDLSSGVLSIRIPIVESNTKHDLFGSYIKTSS